MKLWVFILFLCFTIVIQDVQAEEDCLDKLRSVYNKLAKESSHSKSGTCLYLNYSLTMVSRQPHKVANRSVTTEIYTSDSFTRVYTDEIQLLQDKNNIVVIHPGRKVLFIRSAPPKETQKILFDDFLLVRDSLFNALDVVSCTVRTTTGGRRLRIIHCEIRRSQQALYAYRELTFTLDAQDWSLVGVEVRYPPIAPIESITVVYRTIERRVIPLEFTGSVIRSVLASSGEPIGTYRGYNVTDQRKKKR
jgi:hypothetical protein